MSDAKYNLCRICIRVWTSKILELVVCLSYSCCIDAEGSSTFNIYSTFNWTDFFIYFVDLCDFIICQLDNRPTQYYAKFNVQEI